MRSNDFVIPLEKCLLNISDISRVFCNVTADSVTCWPPTRADSVAKQPCPPIFGAPNETFAYKRCGSDGNWAESSVWKGFGHTDYSECVGHLSMIEEVFDVDKEKLNEMDSVNVDKNRTDNIVFLVILLITLTSLASCLLIINCVIPKRLNQSQNYKIWRQLLTALVLETLLKVVKEISKVVIEKQDVLAITPLCEIFTTSVEYFKTTIYMWFMILVHFHQLTAQSGRLCTSGYITSILIGWGIPIIPTAIWAVTSSLSYKVHCWRGYESQPTVWIIETSRIFILVVAIYFLLQAFSRMSKNSEILNTNCCYRRLYLETLGSAFFSVFITSVSLSKALLYRFSSLPSEKNVLEVLFQVLSSMKGTVLVLIMIIFNSDIRELLEKSVRRISRQELVPASVEENEV